ncbi:MAG: transposase [Roseburia sp.]
MYLDCLVKMPNAPGKIVCQKKGETTYVYYETDRTYDPDKRYTAPKRVTIGKRSKDNPDMIQPNENFVRFFPEEALPEEKDRSVRSSCLRIGTFIVIRQLMKENGISDILNMYLKPKDQGLFLDLASYSIIAENNAAQYYPDYAYNHPLFTEEMKIYSDSKVSEFLNSLTAEQSAGFLNEWNSARDHRQKIYISYDSTNKNCQAGDIEMVEFGNAKDDKSLPIFNYSIAYDTNNREPLFYEKYPGSINDVSQFQFMLDKAKAYGYKKVGFILDRGYFSKKNIEYMDQYGYSFVIMVKGMASFVHRLITENKGTFEEEWVNSISEYGVYGKTIKRKMYVSDKNDRYFHLYYNSARASNEKREIEAKITEMKRFLMNHKNEKRTFGPAYEKYFILHYDADGETFLFPEDKTQVVSDELKLCGYFAIVTSEKMSAKEAISLYKSRDTSEKLFRGDKSYLGNKSLRVYSDESAAAKIFIEFIALIIRCSMYTHLKDAVKKIDQKPNYMTVPAVIRELEKIEMVRQLDGVYRLDHAVTAKQKTILEAFGIGADQVKYRAACISEELKR